MIFRGVGEMNILVMRNITTEPMNKFYENCGHDCGMQINIETGDYDNIIQESMGSRSDLFKDDLDCVLIFARLEGISPKLANSLQTVDIKTVDTEIDAVKEYIERSLMGVREKTDAMIIWHGFELNPYPPEGIAGTAKDKSLNDIICGLNSYAREVIKKCKGTYYLDTNLCMMRVGSGSYYDARLWHIARCPYSAAAMKEIAKEGFKYIGASRGMNKKCIVLDCDNTLWGGVVGEDGINGIRLGRKYPGSEYWEFQQELLNLYNRGVILALCSKNNESDVMEVFKNHPDMILKEKHISVKRINWLDKITNIKSIAQELNIGLDSMVFVDDNEYERGLIKSELPMVDIIDLPTNSAVEYGRKINECGLFDSLAISDEDVRRGEMYKQETERKILLSEAPDIASYLKSLEMNVEVKKADDYSMPRISQLTQKTNQFNLTTIRYGEEDIKKISENGKYDVMYLKLSDNIGDSGITGVSIVEYKGDEAIIGTFLLSCRIIGRGAEQVLLRAIMNAAKMRGARKVIGKYIPTAKNDQTKSFYANNGFVELDRKCEGEYQYVFNLGKELPELPSYIGNIVMDYE